MFKTIKKILSGGSKTDIAEKIANGALIIDVRTPGEFAGGHIDRSINIPLNDLQMGMKKIDKDKILITCCASGMRSGSARNILLANGFSEVYNAGSWMTLKKFEK